MGGKKAECFDAYKEWKLRDESGTLIGTVETLKEAERLAKRHVRNTGKGVSIDESVLWCQLIEE